MMGKFGYVDNVPGMAGQNDLYTTLLNNPIGLSGSMSSDYDSSTGTTTYKSNAGWGTHTAAPRVAGGFQHAPGRGGFGGSPVGGSPGGGGPQYGGGGGLQPQGIQPIAGQSGSAQGLANLSGAGAAGGAPGYSITGAAGSTGAGGGFSWGNAAKWVMGNQRLLTGVVSAAGSLYGSYQDKKAQEKAYNWQKDELAARRAYEQQRIDAARNSPIARMTAPLMKTVLELYSKKLAKRGVNLDLASMLGLIPQ